MLGIGALAGFGLGWLCGVLALKVSLHRGREWAATAGGNEKVAQPRLIRHGP